MDRESKRKIESLTRNLLECYEELDLIYRISRRLLSSQDIQENVELILAEAMDIFEADCGWVVSAVEGEGRFFDPVVVRAAPEVVDTLHQKVVVDLIAAGKSRLFSGLRRELGREVGRETRQIPDTFSCTLLRTDSTVYGALCLGRMNGRQVFTAGDLKLAGVLASQAAVAIENAILHKRRVQEEQAMIRMQEEVRLARAIQEKLLPVGVPPLVGYDIAGASRPAESVGGDYYDFISVDDRHMALCLGDVAGKGMPAALIMAHLQAAIRGQTLMRASPSDCLIRSNTLLFQSTDTDRFATCFYGLLDTDSHCIRYANAGHDRPFLFGSGGDIRYLETSDIVLGLLDDASYGEGSIPIEPGDLLVLYSDGIIDAADAGEHEFGLERFRSLIADHCRLPSRELVDRVLDEVEIHAGGTPQTDDMTLVVIRRE